MIQGVAIGKHQRHRRVVLNRLVLFALFCLLGWFSIVGSLAVLARKASLLNRSVSLLLEVDLTVCQ